MFNSLLSSVFNKKTKKMYNLGSYLDFTKVDDDEYLNSKHIKVVKYKEYKILKYVKEALNDENIESLGLFRSVVLHNNKLVSFAPPKSLKVEGYEEKEENVFEEFVEGTMVNVFYNGEDWIITTRSNINGNNNFYRGSKSFRQMFLEASTYYETFTFDRMNKEYVYSFVLQHPENRMVLEVNDPKLYLVEIYKCNKNNSVECVSFEEEGYMSNVVNTVEKYEISSLEEAKNMYANEESTIHFIQGVVVKEGLKRYKVRNPNYNNVRELRGNQSKIQYQYYLLRKQQRVSDYLRHYPEHNELFTQYRNDVHKFTTELHNNYVSCFILKEKVLKEYDGKYKQHMFKLHKDYKEELAGQGLKVDKRYVINYVNSLEPAELMYSINYEMHFVKKDED